VEDVPLATVSSYGIVKPGADLGNGAFVIDDLVEKPTPRNSPSTLAIAARYILGPEIYPALERTPPGKAGEIQLTDAIKLLLEEGRKIIAVRLSANERRYDIGNFESYFETFIEFALAECPHLARLIRLPG
jgi:UTP--glucose-1-phosphate uridylyltransferase